MSTPHPFDRLVADGAADYRACLPRTSNPYPERDPARQAWFTQWDTAAHEGARILKANAAQRLYKACMTAVVLLRDMRNQPRTLTTRSTRFRDTEIELNTAMSCALASSGTQHTLSGVPLDPITEPSL